MLDQEIYTLEEIEMVSFHPSDISDKRIFASHSILITIGGRGEIRLGDKRYQLDQTGCIFCCNPGTELF